MEKHHYLLSVELFTKLGVVIISTFCTSETEVKKAPLIEMLDAVMENEKKIVLLKMMMGIESTSGLKKIISEGLIKNACFLSITTAPIFEKNLLATTTENVKIYDHGNAKAL